MSGNAATAPTRRTDRRVLRTRDTLGDALIELMQEQPFDDITVQQVLDRAGVGRSTFYTHYRDKDDLFLSDVEDFFEMVAGLLTRRGTPAGRLVPVAELFAHVGEAREVYKAMRASGKLTEVEALGRGFFARSIAARLKLAGMPGDLQAEGEALAGSLFALLHHWIDKGMIRSPAEMDELFHRLAWGGVRAT